MKTASDFISTIDIDLLRKIDLSKFNDANIVPPRYISICGELERNRGVADCLDYDIDCDLCPLNTKANTLKLLNQ